MNLHHLYQRRWVDWYWTNIKINKLPLQDKTHLNHHRVFWNLEFHHQILKILNLNSPILQRHIIEDITSIVRDDPKYVYQRWVFIPK